MSALGIIGMAAFSLIGGAIWGYICYRSEQKRKESHLKIHKESAYAGSFFCLSIMFHFILLM